MKNIPLFCLVCFMMISCKKELENDGDKTVLFSFEILDTKNQSIFINNKFNIDSVNLVFRDLRGNADLETSNPKFRNIDGRIVSKAYEQIGVQSMQGQDYVYTTYVYLSKQDTDTLRIVVSPYSVRDIGSGDGSFPTYMGFYYNGALSAEYDFVKNPELLQPFWRTDDIGQIVPLRKK